ncbi:BZ3500_MvSof-1268-A1-R1_C055g00236 [Microbotryum saponariae]|uniref:BQ2448_6031 protein n=6 Tax=Microbotryum TaxID=34416 RepID=A0A238FI35_9BASI|nr:BQ2448_6031 [Microbotryum intermedium]SCZ92830.1 BZ3500_MvSof-1268-A1-R1_C061g00279 [Microbotryum saponariae]SGZ30123.1 BQ5605_C116g13252 [Microbotryum silenes-dioicae]SCV72907.1 BQ2448_8145 [Microbotryum intermedium]SCV72909.1 BQ2448_8147 [Microbotryum intermedium]
MPPTIPINHYGDLRNQQNGNALKDMAVHQEGPKFDYELFNGNNFNIRYWSWNYRGCWHQTCPPMDPR